MARPRCPLPLALRTNCDGNVICRRVRNRCISGAAAILAGSFAESVQSRRPVCRLFAARRARALALRGLVCVPFPIDDGFALVASCDCSFGRFALVSSLETEPRRLRRWVSSAGEKRPARSGPSREFCSLLLHCGSSRQQTHTQHTARAADGRSSAFGPATRQTDVANSGGLQIPEDTGA